jgi:hypothetical protein
MTVEHTDLDFAKATKAEATPKQKSDKPSRNDRRPVTVFDGRTGEWVRKLHLQAGGNAKTSGDRRLVL